MTEAINGCCETNNNWQGGAFDLAIVGAGCGGFSGAIAASDLGARVALIGHGTIGGTCTNVGCIPSKTLIRATETLHQSAVAGRFAGIRGAARLEDWRALIAQKDEFVARLRQTKYVDLLPSYPNVTYVEGLAQILSAGVRVDGGLIEAPKVVIATGARPDVPQIPGIDTVPYLTSTSALALERLPASLLVIGGGYVGCELAQMFARAGVRVTLALRSRLLPESEPEIGAALERIFRGEGIEVRGGLVYSRVRRTETRVVLEALERGAPVALDAEQVLVATGRRPNTEALGLDALDIALEPDGGIQVDDRMRTTRPGVYAAGDVTGRDMFVYMAAYGARLAAENALNGDTRRYDNRTMPAVIFTDPQVASVGLTESEARRSGHSVRTTTLLLDQVSRSLAARDTRGLVKLVAEQNTDRLLGEHILAPEGADSIQTAVLAIRHGMTVTELADMVFPYLTTVEALKVAAQSFSKDITKLSCCAG
jgi:mercuric reductase